MGKLSGTLPRSQQIQQKAAELFRRHGYANTGMRMLAEALGIEAPSLYNHIAGKTALLQGICQSMGDAFETQLQQVRLHNGEPVAKIESILRFHIKLMMTSFDEMYIVQHEWKHLAEPYRSKFLQLRLHYEEQMAAIIQQGIDNGSFAPLHPRVAVLTMLSAIRGIEFWQRHPAGIEANTLENNMITMLMQALKP